MILLNILLLYFTLLDEITVLFSAHVSFPVILLISLYIFILFNSLEQFAW